ncbi:hypothetical protein [Undibacterium terreum]|uniref:Uncharacterized protein n=1 Tax=Undibacterium terreum TaxID=1224302 RepID=A0A916XDR0_9BURK|nr:hypothetical protein [Undibacterium terreum]GGC64330.1 hypothetical protein GCM10011396_09120 [Undibacterium terreum]
MADDNKTALIELLKYPVTVFSILIALLIAHQFLGLNFGNVTELSASGIKFTQDAKGEITSLASQLNSATAAIQDLQKRLPAGDAPTPQAKAQIFEASQTVSNQTAQIAKLTNDAPGDTQKTHGYMWIGDYKNGWSRIKLSAVDSNEPVSVSPDKLSAGNEFKVLGNMVVRDGLPSNDADYYTAKKSLGIVPVGSKIRFLGQPKGIDREFAVQYWVEIVVL